MPEVASRWPQIGDIVVNHEGGRPASVADLAGQSLSWTDDRGRAGRLHFLSGDRLMWWTQGVALEAPCEVFRVREGWYFVDAVDLQRPGHSHSFVLDLAGRRALQVEVQAPALDVPAGLLDRIAQRGHQSAVDLQVTQGCWDGQAPPFEPTTALLGRHHRYRYSDTHVYDHIYLNERYCCWFCHQGPDAGVGDFEECRYLALAPDLYLVCWQEKLIPCVGVTLEDLQSMRSIGKIFGADAYTGETGNRTVGAAMSLVSTFDRLQGGPHVG